jgi:aminopeptidase N
MVSGKLPNAMFRAMVAGFAAPEQDDLLEPFSQRYFDVVGQVWQDWKPDMAQWFASYAYPNTVVKPETIEATDRYLATANPPAALRRLLTENRDELERKLRCRARDHLAGETEG